MAGKKRSSIQDVPMSKTARASASKGKKKEEGFIASGDVDRIIPLGGGTWAYVLSSDGKTHHVKVGSPKWNDLIINLVSDEKLGARVRSQLTQLGWRNTLGHPD